jgi:hypothetical protein
MLYHRFVIRKEVGARDGKKFTGYLTMFYDSGAIVLPFATAFLIALSRFPDLLYFFQSTVTQNQVNHLLEMAITRSLIPP